MTAPRPKSWKEPLLKTSLPLEHEVTEVLQRRGFHVLGPFSYPRANESGVQTEFSVDVQALTTVRRSSELAMGLELLAECKYSSPGTDWVFAPLPESSLTRATAVDLLQQATTVQADPRLLRSLDASVHVCGRGVVVHNGEAAETIIQRGLTQLRYAIPHFAATIFENQHTIVPDTGRPVILVKALITSATLRVLNRGVGVDACQGAETLDDVSCTVDSLIVQQEPGPLLRQHARDVARELLRDHPRWAEHLNAVYAFGAPDPSVTVGSSTGLPAILAPMTTRLLVVSLRSLDAFLERILLFGDRLQATARTLGRFEPPDVRRDTSMSVVPAEGQRADA